MTGSEAVDQEPRLDMTAVGSMSDEQLLDVERSLIAMEAHILKMAAACQRRARSIRSMISRREGSGGAMVPGSDRRAKGAWDQDLRPDERPTFGDHAMLRYAERAHGLDLDRLRAEMADTYASGRTMAAGAIVESAGMCFLRTSSGFVKTVIPSEWLTEDDVMLAERVYAGGMDAGK